MRRWGWWLLGVLALMGCEDIRYGAAIGTEVDDNGVPDAGVQPDEDEPDAEGPPAQGWDLSEAVVALDEGVQVFPQILWTGRRFGLVWVQNDGGHLFATVSFVDPRTMAVSAPVQVSQDYDDLILSVNTVRGVAADGVVSVVWHTERRLWFREVGDDGALVGRPEVLTDDAGPHGVIHGVLADPGEGFGVAWMDDRRERFNYLPWFARFGPVNSPEQVLLVQGEQNVQIGSVASEGLGGAVMSWQRRDGPGTPDVIRLTRFDWFGMQQGTPRAVYEGDTVHMAYQGVGLLAEPEGATLGVWDVDQGTMLVRVEGDEAVATPVEGGADRPVLARAQDGTLGVLVKTEVGGGFGAGLHLFGAGDELEGEPLILPGSRGASLFGVGIAAGDGGFGMIYESTREVRFVMARPR